ncbi:hypothetical protein [Rhodococcus sp. B10]|uniref:hypothetical protein n=1 Tax=Rhodococcus sp. B10 TaxID=2695876 RepID=UPI0014304D30|nr:hypothetical protein [Rhodococcus sp. B10]NIL77117.1 hypothetical protein [Rhodococcus sp. B10]
MARREVGFKGAKLVGAKIDAATSVVTKTVTVASSATSGTATVVAGSVVLGVYPAGNQDQFVDNVAISGTTLTVTLAAAATATNTYKVTLIEP